MLDAPSLQDDFYLNLVDWSSQNMLAVGLGTCVYLWSASSCKVHFFLSFLHLLVASMDHAQVRLLMAPLSRLPSCAIWGRGTASAPCTGRARAPTSPSAPALETSRFNLQPMHIATKSHNVVHVRQRILNCLVHDLSKLISLMHIGRKSHSTQD